MVLKAQNWKGKNAKSNAHEAHDGRDFDNGEHKLGLTVTLDTHHVNGQYDEEEDGDKDGALQITVPVLQGKRGGDDLEWQDDQPLQSVAAKITGD